jgi:hypothetical protein
MRLGVLSYEIIVMDLKETSKDNGNLYIQPLLIPKLHFTLLEDQGKCHYVILMYGDFAIDLSVFPFIAFITFYLYICVISQSLTHILYFLYTYQYLSVNKY